jgi:transketolase
VIAPSAPSAAPAARPDKAARDAYGAALVELEAARADVVVLDAGVSDSTRTQLFARAHPERFFNLGIAEACMIDVAAGLALAGKTVFASSFAIFAAGRAWEQIRQSVAYARANVKIVATHAGVTIGEDGASAQMIEDLAIMRVLPNMTVLSPADAVETALAVRAAADHHGPVYVRLGRNATPVVFDDDHRFAIGRNTLLREGDDVVVFATGTMVPIALAAADLLAKAGIRAAVVNVSTIKPLDADDIARHAARCGAVVTAEDHSIIGGLGSAVAEVLAERAPARLVRVGIRDSFGRSGTPDELLEAFGLTARDVAQAARRAIAAAREPAA